MMKYLIYIILGLGFVNLQAQENLFDEATNYYAEENYEAAIENYLQILNQGKTSPELYFNLANSYAKLDEIGWSIFYYHKALQLAPHDKDIQNNLSYVDAKKIDSIEERPKTGLANFFDNLISTFDYNSWAVIAIVCSVFILIFGLLYYFTKKTGFKRLFFTLGVLSGVLMLLSVYFGFWQMEVQQSKKYAIIFAKEIAVHNEPNHNSEELFKLHEGTKIKILDVFNNYAQFELANGSRGWITTEAIKEL